MIHGKKFARKLFEAVLAPIVKMGFDHVPLLDSQRKRTGLVMSSTASLLSKPHGFSETLTIVVAPAASYFQCFFFVVFVPFTTLRVGNQPEFLLVYRSGQRTPFLFGICFSFGCL